MQLTCPECHVDCTIDELSVETASCPGCGILLYSKSGRSGALAAQLAAKTGQEIELSQPEIEQTKPWQRAIDEALPVLDEFPAQLGRYQLRQKLGMGSFAEVFLAFDTELGREVALKIPRRNRFTTAQQLSRFLDEARTSAILEHPGIVRVYDIGWLSDEVCFISMEHCAGGTLSDRLKLGSFAADQAVELMISLAEAIHFAHLNGFVHRDLKPSNIMFGRDGKPRIVDFGLAISDETQLKLVGEVAGTLPYMSPEQVSGNTHHLDGRTDIWSLGVIFYQLLVGRRPYSGSRELIIDQIRNREVKPLRQIKDDVPAELESLCLRCLEKSPAARYSTAKDLAQDLLAFREQQSESALKSPSLPYAAPSAKSRKSQAGRLKKVAALFAFFFVGSVATFAVLATKPGKESGLISSVLRKDVGLSPEIQWNLDTQPMYREIPLFNRPPKTLVWPSNSASSTLDFSAHEARLSVTSTQTTLVELGETNAAEIRLDFNLFKPARNGFSGFFWGYQQEPPVPNPGGPKTFTCYGAVFKCFRGPNRRPSYGVAVHYYKFQEMKNGELAESECQYIVQVPVDAPQYSGDRLEVHLAKNGIVGVRWNGNPLSEIQRRFAPNGQAAPVPPFRISGKFGVLNTLGTSLIRNAHFTLLKGPH